MTRLQRFRAGWIVTRDVSLTLFALVAIGREEYTQHVNPYLLGVYLLMLAGPAAINAWALRSAPSLPGTGPTPSQSEQPSSL